MSVSAVSAPSMTLARTDRAVGLWLFLIAAMIGLMVVVGGLTRLTGSGLFITVWQTAAGILPPPEGAPVTGIIPPLNDAAWQSEFAKYQGTPQYDLINRGIGLAGFKAIYWWEWTHRMLGRLLGVVFLIPFLVFLRQGRVDRGIATRLAIIFLLGAAQGVLGWWMVQSGLTGERIAVSQYRLAAHLGLAMILFGYVFWTALEIIGAARSRIASAARFQSWAMLLVALIFVQILLGAFMA